MTTGAEYSHSEEGARFPMITMASGVWAGTIPLETAWSCAEVTGTRAEPRTVKQELGRIGYLGSIPASHIAQPIAAHFELHIEQGPILEEENERVGVVTGAQACQWHEIEVKGRDSHAGTTPMGSRRDSLLAAAKMIVASNEVAYEYNGLVTTGIVKATPGSVNTMAHTTSFTLDMRHPSDQVLEKMVADCREKFKVIAEEDSERGVEVRWRMLTDNKAVAFHQDCIEAVEKAVEGVCAGLPTSSPNRRLWRHMLSGAGHDSCHVSSVSPTAMIFAPTRNGLSHTPDEYCKKEDCILGAQVLLAAVLHYDAKHF